MLQRNNIVNYPIDLMYNDLQDETHLSFGPDMLTKQSLKLIKRVNKNIKRKNIKPLIRHVFNEAFDIIHPYHNINHLYEVLQITTMLIELMPESRFTPSEKTLIQITALFHDYKHFGKLNKNWDDIDKLSYISGESDSSTLSMVEKSLDSHTGIQCTSSYNEYMHFSKAISVILQYKKHMFNDLSQVYIKELIKTLILSTNLEAHDSYVEEIKTNHTKINDMILVIKLADISHPLRSFHVHLYWVYKVTVETNNSQVPTLNYVANDTLYFINTFVKPLVDLITNRYKKSSFIKQHLERTINIWKQMLT